MVLLAAPPPEEALTLRFIGNAGFEITDGTSTILVDFPYQSGAYGYMRYDSTEIRRRDNALCLFTHSHADHFSAERLPGIGCTVAGPSSVLAQRTASEALDEESPWRFGSATIRCIASEHGDVDHCSFVLNWQERDIVVAGDVETVEPVLRQVAEVDLLIMPFWVSEEATAIRDRFPGVRMLLVHEEPGEDRVECAGCLHLDQGESMVL